MADPYQLLGITRASSPDEIRKPYRRLAKKHHPDLHPDDKAAEARFKEIASAYDIIGDEKKRARFDAGEIDASGTERQQQPEREFYRQHAEAPQGFKYERRWNGTEQNEADIFAELFGARGAGARARGSDASYTFPVEFTEAINGAKKRVVMADGKQLDVTISAGMKDGQTLRLRAQGHPGFGGAEPGDILVEVHVKPHPVFRREDNNIRSTLPISLGKALAGTKLAFETVSGTVQLSVPKNANTGTILRLRGKGVPAAGGRGDHLVELKVVLPDHPDDELVASIIAWELKHPYDPRKAQGAVS